MSYWFKCIDTNSPVFIRLEETLGGLAAWQAIKVLNEASRQNIDNLDVTLVSNWASVKRDRAERLLPFVLEIFQECLKIWGKSNENVQKSIQNLQKSNENLVDFTPSNPHGSTRDQERKERLEREELPLTPQGGKAKRGTRLDENWEPDDELLTWALGNHPTVDTRQQTFEFKNHFISNGKTMLDWRRTWQNWISRSLRFGAGRVSTPQAATKVDSRQVTMPRVYRSGKL